MNHIRINQSNISKSTQRVIATMALLVVALSTMEAQAQYRRPAARDEDWVSSDLPGPAVDVRRREREARAAGGRTDVALRSEYRTGESRDGSYDGVAPLDRSANRYDAPVDARYGSNVSSSPSYSTPSQYTTPASYTTPRYNSYSTGATAQATPWRPIGDASPVTTWQVSAADQRPTLNGGYPYYPTSGYPAGYANRGLGYNNVPLNGSLNNSYPTTQVMPINNIQPMPGYGSYGGPGQYYGPDDFNRNGWNWGSNRKAGWAPLIPISAPPTNYVVGQGLWGQPKVYIPNQPIRNGIRYILP